MSLSIGIVGLPNVGKSTLFNALTKNNVLAANYPFATIEPNVGGVGVPDERLSVLAKIFSSEKPFQPHSPLLISQESLREHQKVPVLAINSWQISAKPMPSAR